MNTMTMNNIVGQIESIADHRSDVALLTDRRIIKLSEEVGELSQAYLSLTSSQNRKNMTTEDVLEEAVDCFLVSLDIALRAAKWHRAQKEVYRPAREILDDMIQRKLSKWQASVLAKNDSLHRS